MFRTFQHCKCRCHVISNRYAHNNRWTDPEGFKETNITIGKNTLKISSGRLAKFADGCAVAQLGDTSVMVTAVSKYKSSQSSFLPLTVDYRQKAAAAGRIPTNYLRREMGSSDKEILTSRMIDRSLRPLFPSNYKNETQLMCNLLAVDGHNDPDILSINAASAALILSDIPWNGPVGAVRVGYIDKEIVINPTRTELANSQLNLTVTGTSGNKVVMLEGSAEGITYDEFSKAIEKGVSETEKIVHHMKEMQKQYGVPKREIINAENMTQEILDEISSLSREKYQEIYMDHTHHKISRDTLIWSVVGEVTKIMTDKYEDLDRDSVSQAISQVSKEVFRQLIFDTSKRCDGRSLTDLRNILCDVDLYEPLHGSALFQRGQTQVLCTVTFDSPESAAKLDTISALMSGVKEKNFFLHYEFPPYATNEVGRATIARRELGHGALAEKGLRAIIPNDYPFTIRLTSEVLESNGSSSMGTVCGGCLALMDAGVPIKEAVAGIAIGVVTHTDQQTDKITDYKLLTDLLGIEDYLGDMDFKLAGTRDSMTAVQADIKLPGIPTHIIVEAIRQGADGINNILDIMNKTQDEPRQVKKSNAPVLHSLRVPINKRSKFVGHGGYNLKRLTSQTGVTITQVDETNFRLFAPSQEALDEANEKITEILAEEQEPTLDFGAIYTAIIEEILDHGVLVTVHKKMAPIFVHNSQLDQRRVSHPSALGFKVGDSINVKYFGRDPVNGNIRLSRKVITNKNPVSSLMELCTKRKWNAPIFKIEESGPATAPKYIYKVRVNGVEYKPATFSDSKKSAKNVASSYCLQRLGHTSLY